MIIGSGLKNGPLCSVVSVISNKLLSREKLVAHVLQLCGQVNTGLTTTFICFMFCGVLKIYFLLNYIPVLCKSVPVH